MPEPVDLSIAFGLAPKDAIRYFEKRGYKLAPTFNWDDLWQEAHARAFTVAKVSNLDVLADIRDSLKKALDQGQTFAAWKKDLEPMLRSRGWWGPRVETRPDGTAQVVNISTPWRLNTIFRTNVQTAMMAGHWARFQDNAANRPYLQYVAVMDLATRPAHAAMNGRVFRIDDPIWKTHFPPNGFNCRCRVRALSDSDLARKGIVPQRSDGDLTTGELVDPTTGVIDERTTYKAPRMKQGMTPDAGWNYNVGQAGTWAEDAVAVKARAVLGPGADVALAEITRQSLPAHVLWVDRVFAEGASRGLSRVIGYLDEREVTFASRKGLSLSNGGAIELEDRLLVGPKGRRHQKAGDALSVDEWKLLPMALQSPAAVLWHEADQRFFYLLQPQPDSDAQVVIEAGRLYRKKTSRNLVQSARRLATLHGLQSDIKGGILTLIRGRV